MDSHSIVRAYRRWAPIYDFIFGAVFRKGRSAAIIAAERIGGRILEVGVGTGISLPAYAESSRITGVDISEAMLDKARERVSKLQLRNVEAIAVGDAEALAFPSDSFDVVVAQYVVSAVANPEKALDEFARVCKPGGEIVITTRVGADAGLRRFIERCLMPITLRLGFRTEFPFQLYSGWAERRADLSLVERRELPPLGHFSLLRFSKLAPA